MSATDRVLNLSEPKTISDVSILEEQMVENVRRVMAATVGVRLGPAQASGVIVSSNGYVLTASHVAGAPGQYVKIIMSDGRRLDGRTLGSNPDVDGAMIQITTPGTWAYTPISKNGPPSKGTWCMAVGHPGGVIPGRTPPVRVGRVLQADKYVIRTDATISGGDSGGPLFDMHGQVIGIHSRISRIATDNLHVPAQTYLDTWESLVSGQMSRIRPRSQFLAMFDVNQDSSIISSEIREPTHRKIYERLAAKFDFDPNHPQSIEDLRTRLNLKIAPDNPMSVRKPGTVFEVAMNDAPHLPPDKYTRGSDVIRAFTDASMNVRRSTVEIWGKGEVVALGTVVDKYGRILTKASELPRIRGRVATLKCRLYDNSFVEAEFISEDPDTDFAMLKIKSKKIRPIKVKDDKLVTGQWLITAGRRGLPHSVGVVSVLGRTIRKSKSPYLGIIRSDREPALYGGAEVGNFYDGSPASKTDLKSGDLITSVNGISITSFASLKNVVSRFNVGDYLKMKVKRSGKSRYVYIRLADRERDVRMEDDAETLKQAESLNGPVNSRRAGFSVVVQHDSVMKPTRCGGPVVDIEGRVVGINIARVERTASYMVPARKLKSIITTLKQKGA